MCAKFNILVHKFKMMLTYTCMLAPVIISFSHFSKNLFGMKPKKSDYTKENEKFYLRNWIENKEATSVSNDLENRMHIMNNFRICNSASPEE